MARNSAQIHAIAQKLIQDLPPNRKVQPGEQSYISTSSRLIFAELQKCYEGSGFNPPTHDTVRGWFYSGCPDWVVVILSHIALGQEKYAKRQ